MSAITIQIPNFKQFVKRYENLFSSQKYNYILINNLIVYPKDSINEDMLQDLFNNYLKNNKQLEIKDFMINENDKRVYYKSIVFDFVETDFHKYPSLVNHYAKDKVRFISDFLDKKYYATEKINGENSQIILNKKNEFEYGSRSMLLSVGSPEQVRLNNIVEDKNIKEAILNIKKDFPNSVSINVYGEYYGPGVKKMNYDEDFKNYRVFDVFVYNEDSIYVFGVEELKKYFNENQLVPIYSEVKTLNEFVNDTLENKSLLGGITEGKVYKPYDSYELQVIEIQESETGEVSYKKLFPVIKHKEEKFLEVVKKTKKKIELSEEEQELFNKMISYITEARFENLLSHGKSYTKENFGELIKDYSEDIVKEFTFENNINWKDIPTLVKRLFSKEVAKFIKEQKI
jgi:hypothetical protein